jgi:hypothetical protein
VTAAHAYAPSHAEAVLDVFDCAAARERAERICHGFVRNGDADEARGWLDRADAVYSVPADRLCAVMADQRTGQLLSVVDDGALEDLLDDYVVQPTDADHAIAAAAVRAFDRRMGHAPGNWAVMRECIAQAIADRRAQ